MQEAVAGAKDALVHMQLVPSSIEPLQGAVNTSAAVVTNIKSLTTTWGPLLQEIKMFTEFVDEIARVSCQTDELPAVSDSGGDQITRSTHTLIWHGASSPLCLRFVRRTLYILILTWTFRRPSWLKLIATAASFASSRSWTMFFRLSWRPNPSRKLNHMVRSLNTAHILFATMQALPPICSIDKFAITLNHLYAAASVRYKTANGPLRGGCAGVTLSHRWNPDWSDPMRHTCT